MTSLQGSGGAIYFDLSNLISGIISIEGNTKFLSNRAHIGGAMYFTSSLGDVDVKIDSVEFNSNYAEK